MTSSSSWTSSLTTLSGAQQMQKHGPSECFDDSDAEDFVFDVEINASMLKSLALEDSWLEAGRELSSRVSPLTAEDGDKLVATADRGGAGLQNGVLGEGSTQSTLLSECLDSGDMHAWFRQRSNRRPLFCMVGKKQSSSHGIVWTRKVLLGNMSLRRSGSRCSTPTSLISLRLRSCE